MLYLREDVQEGAKGSGLELMGQSGKRLGIGLTTNRGRKGSRLNFFNENCARDGVHWEATAIKEEVLLKSS